MTQIHEGTSPHENERPSENTDLDPFQELREGLEVMAKSQLVQARAAAIKDLAQGVLRHPSAQDAEPKSKPMSVYGSISPKVLAIPGTRVSITAEVWDMGQFVGSENSMITITTAPPDSDSEADTKELGSDDKPLSGDFSLRDMQAVVDDVVALRDMQEQLTGTE